MQICPSILEHQAEDYLATIKKLSPYFQYFQIDIADGIYVNNKTTPLDDFIKEFISGNFMNFITLPTLKTLVFDFHLMVKDYQREIKKLKKIKNLITIKNIFIHYDLFPNYSLITSHLSSYTIGLTLNPQDQVSDLAKNYQINQIQALQIMSVNPGRQGSPFLPETLKKIEQLRLLGYRSKIFLDGGINNQTLPMILNQKYLPDILCPGSFLTRAKDLKKNTAHLKKLPSS